MITPSPNIDVYHLLTDFPALIWQSGTDARCHYFNRTWLAFTGRTLEEESGDGWTQGIHPDDLENTVRSYLEAFHARRPFELEYRLRRHDGEYRHLVDEGRPIADLEGRFAGYLGSCRDVTARKCAEERLAKSEALLAEAQAVAHIGSWEWDPHSDLLIWSDELFRMVGLRPQERPVSYTYFLSLVHPEDRERGEQIVRQALCDHQPFEYEYRVVLPDGLPHLQLAKGVVVTDENGHPVRLHGTSQDITAQSTAKDALRQSEQRFVAFMDNLPGRSWMKDLDGRYVYVNKEVERLLKLPHEWRGKKDSDLWPETMAAEYRANDQCVLASGTAMQTVEPLLTEGEVRYGLVSKFPIFEQAGRIALVGGISVDITERIRVENALRESEQRFRQLAENIHEVFWIRRVDPWRMEFVSPTYEQMWKHSLEEIQSRPDAWMDAIHPEDRTRVGETAEQLHETGEFDLTYRIVWPDHSIRWIRDRAFPVRDAQGKLVRITGIAEDITERKRTEQQLENLAEMLQILSNRLFEVQEEDRRHLARELHDEIGQSLTAAKLDIEAAKQLEDPAARELRLDDGLAVIEQLLKTVRLMSLDLRPALLDEVGLAAAIRAHFHSHAARGGLAVRLAVDEALPRPATAIEIACFRVAQEALTNILRHSQAKTVEIGLGRQGDELRLTIRDDGKGFDLAEAHARTASGLSFGLLSMRERVHLAGGRFTCKTAAGQGTRIEVHFPYTVPPAEDRYEKAARHFGG